MNNAKLCAFGVAGGQIRGTPLGQVPTTVIVPTMVPFKTVVTTVCITTCNVHCNCCYNVYYV